MDIWKIVVDFSIDLFIEKFSFSPLVLLCVGNFLIGDGCKVYKRNKKIFK
jgi:hypothetical protein